MSAAKISGALRSMPRSRVWIAIKGRTSSCGGGASIRMARLSPAASRTYRRNDASIASGVHVASAKRCVARKSRISAARSAIEHRVPARRPGHRGAPLLRLLAGRQRDVEPVARQERRDALGPLDQANPVRPRLLDAELIDFVRRFEPIEVEMPHGRPARKFIGLDQGEGWTRDVFVAIAEGTDERAGEAGLAAAERTGQRDRVARPR